MPSRRRPTVSRSRRETAAGAWCNKTQVRLDAFVASTDRTAATRPCHLVPRPPPPPKPTPPPPPPPSMQAPPSARHHPPNRGNPASAPPPRPPPTPHEEPACHSNRGITPASSTGTRSRRQSLTAGAAGTCRPRGPCPSARPARRPTQSGPRRHSCPTLAGAPREPQTGRARRAQCKRPQGQ